MTSSKLLVIAISIFSIANVSSLSFVGSSHRTIFTPSSQNTCHKHRSTSSSSQLQMVDAVVLQGAGIGFAGIATGIGLIKFTENAGERSNERGSVSEGLSKSLAGGMIEDKDASSIDDLGGLTSQLENA